MHKSAMLKRRSLLGLLILLTICVSIWKISKQDENYYNFRTYSQLEGQVQQEETPSQQYSPQTRRNTLTSISVIPKFTPVTPRYTTYKRNPDKNRSEEKLKVLPYLKSHIPVRNMKKIQTPKTRSTNSVKNISNINLPIRSYTLNVVSLPPMSVVNYTLLPKKDFHHLIDLHDFEFLMNQPKCDEKLTVQKVSPSRSSPLLLVAVHTAPSNFYKRYLIRETWGSLTGPDFRLIFLVGTVSSTDLQQSLEQENRVFGDMVQGNFIDAYRNMTYKHVMALKWFTYYCREAKFLLKLDDDVFLNTPLLLNYLETTAKQKQLLFCQEINHSKVQRNPGDKWRVSIEEYPGRYYPTYCAGYWIVYSRDVAFRLYVVAQQTPYFWIDDVHVTGTLSQRANIKVTSAVKFLLSGSDLKAIVAGETDVNSVEFIFSWPDIVENEMRSLWNRLINSR